MELIKITATDLSTFSYSELLLMANYLKITPSLKGKLCQTIAEKLISDKQFKKKATVKVPTAPICAGKFILIKYRGSGAFGTVYEVYDKAHNARRAIKIKKPRVNIYEFEKEIAILKKLSLYNIPNVVKYYDSGTCPLLNNEKYYELSLHDENLDNFISNGNKLTAQQLYDIIFELLYTMSLFRKYNFKHRDISPYNILYEINPTPRSYELSTGDTVVISSIIQPIYSDFNTSVFEDYNLSDINDFNDILALRDLFVFLYEATDDTDEKLLTKIVFLIEELSSDDLSYQFIQNLLAKN